MPNGRSSGIEFPQISINQEEIELQQDFLKQNPDLSSRLSEASLFVWFLIQNTVFRPGMKFKVLFFKAFKFGKTYYTDYDRPSLIVPRKQKLFKITLSELPIRYYGIFRQTDMEEPDTPFNEEEKVLIDSASIDNLCNSSEALSEILIRRPLVYYFNVRDPQTDKLYLVHWCLSIQSGPVFLQYRNSYRKIYHVQRTPEIPLTKETGEIMISSRESLNQFVLT